MLDKLKLAYDLIAIELLQFVYFLAIGCVGWIITALIVKWILS